MTDREILQDLLEAVDLAIYSGDWKIDGTCDPDMVISRARKAIEQAQQAEPVAWINKSRNLLSWDKFYADMTPLYTAPPFRHPLSDEEIEKLAGQHLQAFAQFIGAGEVHYEGELDFARAIEAAHGIKE